METYTYTLTAVEHCTLFFALGIATSAAFKEDSPGMAQSFFDLARNISIQTSIQANGENSDGETSNVAPNQVATDGTD